MTKENDLTAGELTNQQTVDNCDGEINCSKQSINNLFTIPWDDILFPYILDRLSWKDLYRLRSVSRSMLMLINDYFSSLLMIDLSQLSNRFTSQAFNILTVDCYNLRILNLSNCKWISNDQLQNLIEQNPNLTSLNISSCFDVTNNCLQRLAVTCKGLKSIGLKDCHWINAIAVTHLVINCPNLEEVDLTSCWEISDDAAIEMIFRCTKLRRLSLSKIYGITDRVLLALSSHSKYLEYLNISGCWRVTDHGVRMIGDYCNNLKTIKVGDCRDVSEESLTFLRSKGINVDVPLPPRPRINLFIRSLEMLRPQM
ncbi:F-box/LRR-repeat protein 15-like isoform X2 [Panonychus citri]|nr:F-box/LRR-repeat protein 15-like isoform X2 [Panonychus citri]